MTTERIVTFALYTKLGSRTYRTGETHDIPNSKITTTTGLQQQQNKISTKVKINGNKTELVVFNKKHSKDKKISAFFNEVEIKEQKEAKYLGVILDKKLTFKSHVRNVRKKSFATLGLLYNLMNRKSVLDKKNKLIIYKMIIKPIMMCKLHPSGATLVKQTSKN